MGQRFSHASSAPDSSKFEVTAGIMRECTVMQIPSDLQTDPRPVYLQKECMSVGTVVNHLSIVVAGGVMRSILVT
jgi:hypothetical protein